MSTSSVKAGPEDKTHKRHTTNVKYMSKDDVSTALDIPLLSFAKDKTKAIVFKYGDDPKDLNKERPDTVDELIEKMADFIKKKDVQANLVAGKDFKVVLAKGIKHVVSVRKSQLKTRPPISVLYLYKANTETGEPDPISIDVNISEANVFVGVAVAISPKFGIGANSLSGKHLGEINYEGKLEFRVEVWTKNLDIRKNIEKEVILKTPSVTIKDNLLKIKSIASDVLSHYSQSHTLKDNRHLHRQTTRNNTLHCSVEEPKRLSVRYNTRHSRSGGSFKIQQLGFTTTRRSYYFPSKDFVKKIIGPSGEEGDSLYTGVSVYSGVLTEEDLAMLEGNIKDLVNLREPSDEDPSKIELSKTFNLGAYVRNKVSDLVACESSSSSSSDESEGSSSEEESEEEHHGTDRVRRIGRSLDDYNNKVRREIRKLVEARKALKEVKREALSSLQPETVWGLMERSHIANKIDSVIDAESRGNISVMPGNDHGDVTEHYKKDFKGAAEALKRGKREWDERVEYITPVLNWSYRVGDFADFLGYVVIVPLFSDVRLIPATNSENGLSESVPFVSIPRGSVALVSRNPQSVFDGAYRVVREVKSENVWDLGRRGANEEPEVRTPKEVQGVRAAVVKQEDGAFSVCMGEFEEKEQASALARKLSKRIKNDSGAMAIEPSVERIKLDSGSEEAWRVRVFTTRNASDVYPVIETLNNLAPRKKSIFRRLPQQGNLGLLVMGKQLHDE